MAKHWQASSPSNIAWIKYMGKKDHEKNIPTNSSLSWTLDYLQTQVQLSEASEDSWAPLPSDYPFTMSETGRHKYLQHLNRMKEFFGVTQNFQVQSANNFPADCGIASSASSFAALTEVCCQAFSEITGQEITLEQKANLSAQGSGSSCRSFLPGLVVWDEKGVRKDPMTDLNLSHIVVLVGEGAKKVSSSEAHKRVASSDLFAGRVERSMNRMKEVQVALENDSWEQLYETLWAEFWDMHALFETCSPPFGYFLPGTQQLLNILRDFWQTEGTGPLVTMDAGPNIHLLWKDEQKELALQFFNEKLQGQWTCLSDIEEIGFAQV